MPARGLRPVRIGIGLPGSGLDGFRRSHAEALEAYLEKHPDIARDMPQEWQTTISLARAEVQGQISGAFHAGFTAELAGAARDEITDEDDAVARADVKSIEQ